MRRTRIAAIAAAVAVVAAGSGVAVATTISDDAKEREQAVLEDAAKRLDVTPSELRDALGAAQDEQLDADVKAGRLTQEQADAIKERREQDGTVLGGPGFHGPGHPGGRGFGHHRFGGPGLGGPSEVAEAAADALGISRDELFERLRDGDTLGEIAEAEGKDFADVRAAVRTALEEHLDEAVEHGPLTRAQADRMLERLLDGLEDLGGFRHRGGPPPVPAMP